jgi:hypothetical protein
MFHGHAAVDRELAALVHGRPALDGSLERVVGNERPARGAT